MCCKSQKIFSNIEKRKRNRYVKDGLGWISAVIKSREKNFDFNSIEFKSNLFESLNCWNCLKVEIELKLFWIYLNCNLELKYFTFI